MLVSIGNWAAALVLCISGLLLTMQASAVPSDVFIRKGNEPVCSSYAKPKFKPWACAGLPALSVDFTPTAFAALVSALAIAWLLRGPKKMPIPDLMFFSQFFIWLPPLGRLEAVAHGVAPGTFLLGALPFVAASLGVLLSFFRGHPPFESRGAGA